jgi:hypothetical protein
MTESRPFVPAVPHIDPDETPDLEEWYQKNGFSLVCEVCASKQWWAMGKDSIGPSFVSGKSGSQRVYVLACANCGNIRQHLVGIADGRVRPIGETDNG